jgi:hypothetical protein
MSRWVGQPSVVRALVWLNQISDIETCDLEWNEKNGDPTRPDEIKGGLGGSIDSTGRLTCLVQDDRAEEETCERNR